MRPTEKDITKTPDGYYFLECDGRHSPLWHRYLYYTKKEVIALWRKDHPRAAKISHNSYIRLYTLGQ